MPAAHLSLAAHARNVSQARSFLRNALHNWHCDDLTDAAELLVSELVSNAILHARSALDLVVTLDAGHLLVEVRDDSSVQPMRRKYGDDATTGRGLQLVDHLSAGDWGCRADGDGKVVWARISLH